MTIKEKLNLDKNGLLRHGPVNIVILGDSVSHGAVVDNLDYENVYWNQLKKMLNHYRDYVPVNMICASVGGTLAKDAVPRLKLQVFSHNPDLVIISFGLNDVNHPIEEYLSSLKTIFVECQAQNVSAIFMTPNMLNTYVADDTAQRHLRYAHVTTQYQNEGRMDHFMHEAVTLAKSMDITVCDCYQKWKELSKTVDTTTLLANRINHPVPEMHTLFAESLYALLIGDDDNITCSNDTMYLGK